MKSWKDVVFIGVLGVLVIGWINIDIDTFLKIVITILLIIGLLLWYTIIVGIGNWLKNGSQKEQATSAGIKCTESIIYVGGFRDLLSKQNGTIKMFDDRLQILLPSKQAIIDYVDIIDIEGMSETQISKDVTLTRLLLVGIFAFGLKKTTESTRKFFTITYKEAGKEHKVIFECVGAEKVIRQYDSLVRA